MKIRIAAALAAVGLSLAPLHALAEDNEAGVPLSPAEAAGAWTLSTGGQDHCVLTLGGGQPNAPGGYPVTASGACDNTLPSTPTGWQPTHDGMQLMGADGQTLINLHRWSNSLFVSGQAAGDIQLRRGGPNS